MAWSPARSAEARLYRGLYDDQRWRGPEGIRLQRLMAEPLCRNCKAEGRIVAATVCDHIAPHRGDPELFFDFDNTQSLCDQEPWRCHSKHKQSEESRGYSNAIGEDGWPLDSRHPSTGAKPAPKTGNSMTHPEWFRPVYVPLTIVCGPPGGGKSTYVERHASKADLVICFDRIAASMFGSRSGNRAHADMDGGDWRDVLRKRNESLADLMRAGARRRWPAAWLIVSEPKPERRQWWSDTLKPARIVVLTTPADVCKQRVLADTSKGDKRHSTVAQSIDKWWREYKPRDGDLTV